jgi:subtilisin
MRRRLVVGGALAALLVLIVATMPSAAAAPSGRTASYIVVLKGTGTSGTQARAHANRYGAKVGHVYRHALNGYSATLSTDRLAALKADPNVAAVVPDLTLHAFAQTLPTGINRIDGEMSSTVSGNGSGAVNVDVAVIDTGIASHPDLTWPAASTASAAPASTTTTATAPTWPAPRRPGTTPTGSSGSLQGRACMRSRC